MGARRTTGFSIHLVLVDAKPPLRALADVKLACVDGEVTLRRFAVFEKSGEPAWASVPRLPSERNGRKAYVPLIELPKDLKDRILKAVLVEYRRACDAEAN